MATKKIFRLDMFIEFVRQAFAGNEIQCYVCPFYNCGDGDYLCSKKDEFKKAITERFSTEVEVVEDDGFAQAILDRFSTEVE